MSVFIRHIYKLYDIFEKNVVNQNLKLNFMKIFFLLLKIIIIVNFASCSKDDSTNLIPSGIQTRIYGNVTSSNGESLSEIEVKIGEYIETGNGGAFYYPANLEFKQIIKTINLEPNGSFDFTFETSGNGNFYKMFIGDYPSFETNGQMQFFEQKIDDPLGVDLTTTANDMSIIGKEFNVNHIVKKLHLCEVTLDFNLTNFYPIKPFHLLTYSFNNN